MWLTKLAFLVLLSVQCIILSAQNLIPNGSFEGINICTEYTAQCSPDAWFNVANAPKGFSVEPSGNYIAILAFNSKTETRSYWQTKLLCKLQPGEKYKVSVTTSAYNVGPNINDIGFYLTNNFIISNSDTLLQPPSYISFSDANYKKLSNKWFKLEKEFIATDSSEYLIIGNFSNKSNREILSKRKRGQEFILVDDLSIIPENSSVYSINQHTKEWLYSIKERHSFKFPKTKTDSVYKEHIVEKTEPKIDTFVIGNIQFDFDSYKLIDTAVLKSLRRLLDKGDISKVKITGFTDDAGSEKYNLDLSKKRAAEIETILRKLYRMSNVIVETEGKGISNDYDDKRLNRRVEIYLYHDK